MCAFGGEQQGVYIRGATIYQLAVISSVDESILAAYAQLWDTPEAIHCFLMSLDYDSLCYLFQNAPALRDDSVERTRVANIVVDRLNYCPVDHTQKTHFFLRHCSQDVYRKFYKLRSGFSRI
jgi:hypothetical protein